MAPLVAIATGNIYVIRQCMSLTALETYLCDPPVHVTHGTRDIFMSHSRNIHEYSCPKFRKF